MTGDRVVLASLSLAMDGGFTAIADVADAMTTSGTIDQHRLIGGVAVMLHIERLRLDLPLRATGDADFGVPPHVLRHPDLVDAIEALGYHKVAGNRWERRVDDRRVAVPLGTLTAGLLDDRAARLRTRVRALLADTIGPAPSTD